MFNRLLIVSTIVLLAIITVSAQPQGGRPQGGRPNLSPEEQNLVRNIQAAKDPAEKMKAVAEMIKKYPKSPARPFIARMGAEQIEDLQDANQKLSFAQQYQTIFDQPNEEELIFPVLVEAYATLNRPDEAFTKGADFLSRHPDSLRVLVGLLALGTDQVKKQNGKYIAQSIQYGTHAAELFEGDKKPVNTDDAQWKTYKSETLPGVYQSLGLLYYASSKIAEAKANYLKASDLSPTDPFNFVMLAGLLNQDYQNEAKKYQSMPAGPARDEELKKTQAVLDQVIDAYAHAIALSEGNATLQQIRQQYLGDLETYYKYRHGSTDGMQQLIDKYKTTKP
jgi:hypothetical protein